MRTLRIDLMGQTDNFAFLARKSGSRHIDVEILLACKNDNGETEGYGRRVHHVQADCEAGIRSMAERLQRTLDGYEGTNSEIEEYVRVLQHFAD